MAGNLRRYLAGLASLSSSITVGRPPLRPWAFAATSPVMVRDEPVDYRGIIALQADQQAVRPMGPCAAAPLHGLVCPVLKITDSLTHGLVPLEAICHQLTKRITPA